jgi:hypothetical protein
MHMNWIKATAHKKQRSIFVNLARVILLERAKDDSSTRVFFTLEGDHADVEETPEQLLKAGKANA